MSSSSNSSRHNRSSHPNRQEDDNDDSNENQVQIKFLLPGTTTGSVIGKGGERIASLQKETNTKIKMSKSGVISFVFIHRGRDERVFLGLFSRNTRTCLSCHWPN